MDAPQQQSLRILLTGSEGFVGRHLAPRLEALGHDVHKLDTKLGLEYSVENYVESTEDDPWDIIIHLAANIKQVDERFRSSVELYADLELDLAMARYVERCPPRVLFMYPSSAATDLPRDPYAWVKLTGEHLCRHLSRQGVPVTVIRPFSGYGEDQAPQYPFRAILDRALRGERPIKVWGSGDQVRDWLHIDDFVGAIVHLLDRAPCGSIPIDIGTGVGTPFRTLAEKIARAVNPRSPAPVMPDTTKPESSWSRVANTRALRALGFVPQVSLDEGIRRAVIAHQEAFAEATD